MGGATDNEIRFFDAVARAAHKLTGIDVPDWYLRAVIDLLLDAYELEGALRDDAGPRALFILRRLVQIESETPVVVQTRRTFATFSV